MKGVVVCPQPRAADVGAAILARGGNAFDGADATAATVTSISVAAAIVRRFVDSQPRNKSEICNREAPTFL